jgi:hypothetical protein
MNRNGKHLKAAALRLFSTLFLAILAGCGGSAGDEAMEQAIEVTASKDGEKVDVEIDTDADGTRKMNISSETGTVEYEAQSSAEGEGSFSMTASGPEGEMKMVSGEGAALPEGFPEDVPTPEDFKVTFAQSMEENTYNVMGNTASSVADVIGFYANAAQEGGWKELNTVKQNSGGQEMQMAQYEKEGRTLQVVATSTGGDTSVTLSLTKAN